MTTTTTNAATENKITVESARANGLSMEEFLAANAGLSVEEYRAREEEKARKAEETAKAYALQAKIDTCKSTINFYDEKSRRAAWYLYNAVIKGDEDQATFIASDIAEFENKVAEAKKELADLEPATDETTAEDNVEAESAPDNTKTPNEVYRPFTVEAETVNMHGQTFSFINIYGERVTFVNGEVHIISSDKYDAHFNRQTGKYVAAVVVDGNFKPITFNTAEEFFAEMVKRGACTIDEQKPTPEHPTDDELNQPTTAVEEPADKSEPTEVKHGAKFIEGKFYNDMDWATFGAGKNCFKILKRTVCYVTIGDYSPYWKNYLENGRYKIQTDSDGNEYINYWSGKRLCAKFLTVDEHIRGSLERAAEIARQKYREYEREGDKAGMRHESELFEICRKAIKELEAA